MGLEIDRDFFCWEWVLKVMVLFWMGGGGGRCVCGMGGYCIGVKVDYEGGALRSIIKEFRRVFSLCKV